MKRLTSFISLISFLLLFQNLPTSLSARRSPTNVSNSIKKQVNADNYYTVLGLSKNAKKKEIKSKFRKLALRYHPDKIKDGDDPEENEHIFVKVSEAYAVLSDKKKKKIYDQYGKNGLAAFEKGQDPASAGFGGGGFGGGGGGGSSQGFGGGQRSQGFNGDQSSFNFGGAGAGGRQGFGGGGGGGGSHTQGGFDPFSMFEDMFAGKKTGGGGQQQQQQQQKKRPTAQPDLFPKGESHVAKLGRPKFPDKKSRNMWLIMFYANDNKESRQVSEKYETLAAQSNLPYKVGAVDCRLSEREEKFCAEKGIDSAKLPSFSLVIDGKLITYDEYVYRSSSSKAFHTFCMENMPKQYINNINNLPQMEERLLFTSASNPNLNIKNRSSLPAVLLVTDKYETSSMFYSLSYYFRKDFVFGESRAKNLKLSQAFAVKKYPTLVAFVPLSCSELSKEKYNDEYGLIRYTGPLKKEKITTWLEKIKTNIAKGEKKNHTRLEMGERERST
ncbi:MAG: curved DNA-binding protein CbpA [Bacillariaceae sp.]|jgi:curved DNA-binding protein CbpA